MYGINEEVQAIRSERGTREAAHQGKLRVVLDTIYIIGLGRHLVCPARSRDGGASRSHHLPALLAELTEVLNRPHLSARLQRVCGSVVKALEFYTAFTVSVTPTSEPRIVPNDLDDDHAIAAVMVGQADIIASGDHYLLSLGTHQEIRILRPAEMLASITGTPEWRKRQNQRPSARQIASTKPAHLINALVF